MKNLIRYCCFLFCCLLPTLVFSQKDNIVDKHVELICKDLQEYKVEGKILDFKEFYQASIIKYKLTESISSYVYIRLQKNCKDFAELSYRSQVDRKSDWELHKSIPEAEITKIEAKAFFTHDTLYYLESTNDLVLVDLRNGMWIEHFVDESTSHLTFKKTGKTKFQIKYVKSNNSIRKKMSLVGDKYYYEILKKFDDYYWVCTVDPKRKLYYTFKLYLKNPKLLKI